MNLVDMHEPEALPAWLAGPVSIRAHVPGGQRAIGTVRVSGAKNSVTRLLAAAMLTDDSVVIGNAPTELVDLNHKIRFMRGMGVRVSRDVAHETLTITSDGLVQSPFDGSDDFPIRTTYLLVAGQIRKAGRARIPYPGGCKIGSRGYDLHVMVWQALGCRVEEKPGWIEVIGEGFTGGRIVFPITTVGGTENALICGALARGTTEVINAYITPEIEDLIDLLRRMGAQIDLAGSSRVRIEGVDRLSGARKDTMSDRIEALTWIVLGLMTRSELRIENVPFANMEVPLLHIEKAGIDFFRNRDSIYLHPDCLRFGAVQPFELSCGAHPGIISDMQPFYTLLGLVADGTSRIYDYRYPERYGYALELAKLCADGSLEASRGEIVVRGPISMRGTTLRSTDLRGSMALLMAALCAEGESTIEDFQMALRGYNNLQAKLAALGIGIEIKP